VGKNKNGCGNGNGFKRGKESSLAIKSKELHPMIPLLDKEGRSYVPMCHLANHLGIMGRAKAKRCEKKGCFHYRRYYEEIPEGLNPKKLQNGYHLSE